MMLTLINFQRNDSGVRFCSQNHESPEEVRNLGESRHGYSRQVSRQQYVNVSLTDSRPANISDEAAPGYSLNPSINFVYHCALHLG